MKTRSSSSPVIKYNEQPFPFGKLLLWPMQQQAVNYIQRNTAVIDNYYQPF